MKQDPLEASVLILDKNYHPIKISTSKVAVMLLFSEKALVLDSSYNTYNIEEWMVFSKLTTEPSLPVLRSAKINLIVPEVVILPTYMRKPGHAKKLKYSRSSIFRRDNYCCQYCGKEFSRKNLTVDHIIPKSRGGKSSWFNVTSACQDCNWKKADKTPEEAGMKLLNPPRVPTWKDNLELPGGMRKDIWENFL